VRIGINALFLVPGGVGGTEIYLTSLLHALELVDQSNEYLIFINCETAVGPSIAPSRFRLIACAVRARSRPQRILWEQLFFPAQLARHRVDVLLNPGFTMPILFQRPSVTVFHDLQHRRHPEFFRWFDLPFWNLLLWSSAKRSRSLIAVSDATARDIGRYYSDVAHKTVVIPHGVDPEFFRVGERRAGRSISPVEKYLLTVSTLHPHKNIGRLLEAFHIFRALHPEYRLIVAGLRGHATAAVEQLRRSLNLDDSVTLTGWIARDALYNLFEHADAFVAPSSFEGFGMPLIEALAAGIPTACSGISPLTDIAGDAATQFDPASAIAIADAMELIATDAAFRAQAVAAGPARARQFDWATTAQLTLWEIERAARQTSQDG
jgi:glycosyltransferase involved in cell wall biosynthesis